VADTFRCVQRQLCGEPAAVGHAHHPAAVRSPPTELSPLFSGAGPYPPKGFALTGGTATDVSGAAGGVVVVADCPRVMPPP
jgi:hypothetical protein